MQTYNESDYLLISFLNRQQTIESSWFADVELLFKFGIQCNFDRSLYKYCVGATDGNMDDQELNEPQNRVALLKGNGSKLISAFL